MAAVIKELIDDRIERMSERINLVDLANLAKTNKSLSTSNEPFCGNRKKERIKILIKHT